MINDIILRASFYENMSKCALENSTNSLKEKRDNNNAEDDDAIKELASELNEFILDELGLE